MDALTAATDLPTRRTSAYLNAASVALMYRGAERAAIASHLNAARVVVSPRGDFVRFSPHLYNQPEDIRRALEELDRCLP